MTKLSASILAATLALAGCASDPGPAAVDQFIGKRLVSDDGTTFVFLPDGVVSGTIRDEPIIGEYTSTATEICSTYQSPEFLTGREFCSTPSMAGGNVVFLRRDGSRSQVYRIEG